VGAKARRAPALQLEQFDLRSALLEFVLATLHALTTGIALTPGLDEHPGGVDEQSRCMARAILEGDLADQASSGVLRRLDQLVERDLRGGQTHVGPAGRPGPT
jgi:hypothetical protein